jgi:hypothetical protein
MSRGVSSRQPQTDKSFLLLFFKKEGSFLSEEKKQKALIR